MQRLTNNYLLATLHKVGMNTRERFAFAYFHEPNFCAEIRSLRGPSQGSVHYGTHFTNMFMRNYPERVTAQRMNDERRQELLQDPELHRFN
jgi:isopenicillin N synthase-like dioxygenase